MPNARAASRTRRDWSAREDAGLAEDVREARPAVGGDPGELLVDERAHERLGPVRPRPELGRDGVGAEPGRHDVHRALAAQAIGDLEQAELGLEVQPVAGLRLDRRDAVAEHLVEPAPAVREQLALGRGAGRGDGRQDPAALGQDVEIGGAALAHARARPRACPRTAGACAGR